MIILRKKKKVLELYPIGSSKGALNSRRKPSFKGFLKMKRVGEHIRPVKFILKTDKEKLLPPAEAIKILRKQNIFLVGEDSETEEMLSYLNISYRKTQICNHCTFEGYITLIKRDKSYLLNDEYICRLCAEEEIKRELEAHSYDMNTFPNFKKILKRTGDLEEVLKLFKPNFDPLKNPQLTFYDRITSGNDKDFPTTPIDKIDLPTELITIIKKEIPYLLPVQILAIQAGLLEGQSQLVVSATASGKTLIGELAGVPRALKGQKFVYLTPLVALANQKYRDFKKRYGRLGLKISIRVGMSRIKAKEEFNIRDEDVKDADIIVGTYEGFDFLLRSGRLAELQGVGTVVVDEIQTLDDEERGSRLNGLIKRLIDIFPQIQIIGLSATVKNPSDIAREYKMNLVEYGRRPVPLERHLIFTRSEFDKEDFMAKLSYLEYHKLSKKGYHGQTIIFTNSRRKTHEIAGFLRSRKIKAAAYHAGLSYAKKISIERQFLKQEISVVVTTAALSAGVDFPASQVIFESLTMGNNWITPNEFHQMLGRAGRPSYHDRGIVYLLPEIAREFDNETEESVALYLLESGVESIKIHYSEDDLVEQFLADICAFRVKTVHELLNAYKKVEMPLDFYSAYNIIGDYGLINENDGNITSTPYGRAVSISFLHHEDADYIRKNLGRIDPLELVLCLEPFDNAYLSNRLINRLGRSLKINLSARLFADSTLDILSSTDNLAKLDSVLQEKIIQLQMQFFSCECKDKPFCTCFQAELSRLIIKQRIQKNDPVEISARLMKDFEVQVYAGDIFSWLDAVIRMLESIERISRAIGKKKVSGECKRLIRKIEN